MFFIGCVNNSPFLLSTLLWVLAHLQTSPLGAAHTKQEEQPLLLKELSGV